MVSLSCNTGKPGAYDTGLPVTFVGGGVARYRNIDLRMWGDRKFRRLSPIPPCGQGLWIYLLSGPHTTNIPGLSRITEMGLASELKWPLEAFREAFRESSREDMVKADWDAPLLWIPNAIRYNEPQSPNVIRGWRYTWDELPECDLKAEAYQSLKAFLKAFGEAFLKAFLEALPEAFPKAFGESGTGTGSRTGSPLSALELKTSPAEPDDGDWGGGLERPEHYTPEYVLTCDDCVAMLQTLNEATARFYRAPGRAGEWMHLAHQGRTRAEVLAAIRRQVADLLHSKRSRYLSPDVMFKPSNWDTTINDKPAKRTTLTDILGDAHGAG